MINDEDLENAYDDLSCKIEDYLDNKDDESYSLVQKQLTYIGRLIDDIANSLSIE